VTPLERYEGPHWQTRAAMPRLQGGSMTLAARVVNDLVTVWAVVLTLLVLAAFIGWVSDAYRDWRYLRTLDAYPPARRGRDQTCPNVSRPELRGVRTTPRSS
jgi:hypothetical protein